MSSEVNKNATTNTVSNKSEVKLPRHNIRRKKGCVTPTIIKETSSMVCTSCGKRYVSYKTHFIKSKSPMYASNEGRVTVCRACIEKMLEEYRSSLGDKKEAIRRMCMYFGMYIDEGILSNVNINQTVMAMFSEYLFAANKGKNKDKLYDDYIFEKSKIVLGSDRVSTNRVTDEQLERWGPGFSPEEYPILDDHYNSLNEQYSSDDAMQDIYIKDLCELKVLQFRAISSKQMDEWMKYKSLYQKTAKEANLNPKKKKDADQSPESESWGKFISMVEEYCPADYYKDKKKFVDFFGIKKSIKNDLLRPLRNLLAGSKDVDVEYTVDLPSGEEDNGADA